jgi:hypothetical protein
MTERELLFRVTRADLEETPIRGRGPGGQHRNKSHTGIRLVHPASGARAEATDSRSQTINRQEAWRRLRETPEFRHWFREMVATTMGRPSVEQEVSRLMAPENITTQVLDDNGRWTTVAPEELT